MHYYTTVTILVWLSLVILCVLVYENDRIVKKDKLMFFLTYMVIGVSALAEWMGIYLNGNEAFPAWGLKIVKCCDYILTPVAGGAMVAQLRRNSIWQKLIMVMIAVNTVFQLITSFTGGMLIVDRTHHYSHGSLYILYSVLYFLIIVFFTLSFLFYGRGFRRQNRFSLYAVLILIVMGILIQEILGGEIRTAYLSLTLGMAFMFIHNTEFSQIELEDRLKEKQLQMMLSQIQPHFIQNSLGAIQEMCYSEPEAAGDAVEKFSTYLRDNILSINKTGLIPFKEELEHTKLYLELEKMRFGDRLAVGFDIACADFSIPVLTLQPIVENAVRYGVRKKRQPVGHVEISTKEYSDRYEISITDNGAGFDPDMLKNLDEKERHVGISNVRDRLLYVCNGRLEIDSVKGEGTTATLIIPKKGSKNKC